MFKATKIKEFLKKPAKSNLTKYYNLIKILNDLNEIHNIDSKATIYYLLSEWISNDLMLVPALFITELLAQQSAVPVIGHSH